MNQKQDQQSTLEKEFVEKVITILECQNVLAKLENYAEDSKIKLEKLKKREEANARRRAKTAENKRLGIVVPVKKRTKKLAK